jgi:hypothetical protein
LLHAAILSIEFIRVTSTAIQSATNVSIRRHRLQVLGREEAELWGSLGRLLFEVGQRRRLVGSLVVLIPIGRVGETSARVEILVGVDTRLHDA